MARSSPPKSPAARKAPAARALPAAPTSARAIRVLRSFRLVFNAVKDHFRQVEKKTGVAGAQIWALGAVHQAPHIGVTELARAMDVHQSTASNLVRSLADKGLL